MNGMTIKERLTKLETEMIALKRLVWIVLGSSVANMGVLLNAT